MATKDTDHLVDIMVEFAKSAMEYQSKMRDAGMAWHPLLGYIPRELMDPIDPPDGEDDK